MKITIKILFLFLCSTTFAQNHLPKNQNGLSKGANLRVFKKWKNYHPSIQYTYIEHPHRSNEKLLQLGSKYRLYSKLKLGLYFAKHWGARHDEDWIVRNGKWHWLDGKNRDENLGILEASPRILIKFLPGIWIGELRARYIYNFSWDKQLILLRPGLNYVFDSGNIFLMHEAYFPLNYSEETIYANWWYVGYLYHFSSTLRLGPFLTYGKEKWTESEEIVAKNKEGYVSFERETRIGLNINVYF